MSIRRPGVPIARSAAPLAPQRAALTTVLAMGATRVAVIGASGRMGATVCAAVEAASDLELVGRFDVGDDLGNLAGAQVVVEFSVPDASPANVAHCVAKGVHVVVGTTGWSDERLATLREQVAQASALYARIKAGQADGIALSQGAAVRTGWLARLALWITATGVWAGRPVSSSS